MYRIEHLVKAHTEDISWPVHHLVDIINRCHNQPIGNAMDASEHAKAVDYMYQETGATPRQINVLIDLAKKHLSDLNRINYDFTALCKMEDIPNSAIIANLLCAHVGFIVQMESAGIDTASIDLAFERHRAAVNIK